MKGLGLVLGGFLANILRGFSLTLGALLALSMCSPYSHAREGDDHGNHGDLKPWFDGLRSKKGMCCSFADGQQVNDVDWDTQDGHYRVRLHGDWIVVPDDAVISEPNRFGPAVVWPYDTYTSVQDSENEVKPTTQIRCFIPGAGT